MSRRQQKAVFANLGNPSSSSIRSQSDRDKILEKEFPKPKLRIKKVTVKRYGEPVTRYKVYAGRERIGNYMGYSTKKDALAVGRSVKKDNPGHNPSEGRISEKKLTKLLEEGYNILDIRNMGGGHYSYLLENPAGKQEHYTIKESRPKKKKTKPVKYENLRAYQQALGRQ